jgi:hypothetical protein
MRVSRLPQAWRSGHAQGAGGLGWPNRRSRRSPRRPGGPTAGGAEGGDLEEEGTSAADAASLCLEAGGWGILGF